MYGVVQDPLFCLGSKAPESATVAGSTAQRRGTPTSNQGAGSPFPQFLLRRAVTFTEPGLDTGRAGLFRTYPIVLPRP